MEVKEGSKIKVEYEGTFDDGKVFDTNKGKDPLAFEVRKGMVVKGFDNAVMGMKKDEEKTVKLSPEEGYGQRNEKLIQELPKDKMPQNMEVKEGMMLMFKGPNGESIASVVKEVAEKTVKIDLNHPLAGKNLNFKIKVLDVE